MKRTELKRTPLKAKPKKRKKPRERGVYCIGPEHKRCPRKRYPGTDLCNIHYADSLARAYVMARDKSTCRRCGKSPADWAHVFSRRYKLIRWDPINSMALCRACHMWQTQNPLEGDEFFTDQLGAKTISKLRVLALGSEKPNPEHWIAVLAPSSPKE